MTRDDAEHGQIQVADALIDKLARVQDLDAWLRYSELALAARESRHFDVTADRVMFDLAASCGRMLVAWRRDVDGETIGGELADADWANPRGSVR